MNLAPRRRFPSCCSQLYRRWKWIIDGRKVSGGTINHPNPSIEPKRERENICIANLRRQSITTNADRVNDRRSQWEIFFFPFPFFWIFSFWWRWIDQSLWKKKRPKKKWERRGWGAVGPRRRRCYSELGVTSRGVCCFDGGGICAELHRHDEEEEGKLVLVTQRKEQQTTWIPKTSRSIQRAR